MRGLTRIFSKLTGSGLARRGPVSFEPLTAGGLTVQCATNWPADAGLLDAWQRLCDDVPASTVFQGPIWQTAAWKTLRGATDLRFLTVHRDGRLAAVLPLYLTNKGGLITPAAAVTDYLDPLIRPDDEPAVWSAILDFLAQHWDRHLVEVTLHNVRESAACRNLLPPIAERGGFTCEERVVEYAPAIKLAPTWDGYLQSLDPHERKELRRKLNKAEQKAGASLTKCLPDEIDASLQTALRLMEACGGEKGDAVCKYLRPLLELAAPELIRQGRMELWMLRLGGEVACCLLQIPHPAGPLLYNCGYDPAKKEWSPGVVAVAISLREAIANRAQSYDLLRGQEPYKYRLGAVDRALVRITLKRK